MDAHHTLLADNLDYIKNIESFEELGAIRRLWLQKCKGQIDDINLVHSLISRQCILLSISKTAAYGMGDSPPVPYAFLLFGSGGRKEQTLMSDQDNGLIYQVPEWFSTAEQDEVHRYFQQLTHELTLGLSITGYPPCEGNVMSSNPRWRGPCSHWNHLISSWCEEPTWENVRHLLLLSDARLLIGDESIYKEFRDTFFQETSQSPFLLSRFVSNTLHHQVPLGWFGRLLPEINGKYRGAVNIKNGVYLPFVNCIRLFAIAHNIRHTPTLERLHCLSEMSVWNSVLCQSIHHHFTEVVNLRILASQQWEDGLYQSNSYLKLTDLTKLQRSTLKDAMKLALQLQQMTTRAYAKAE
ncbi:DUF294 nucleotidyltransferase-like domain-containing protein [Brevibacillus sp. SYSU BS000544]|uniref:DUF294 nucleotidyltransferase-like domain-containing protein n=1 Tax=Brevibacillus sp. SYSU BS000544 TaxID=3416443 RepID=UPI003CE4EF4F